jgi:hypothetical protein
MKPHYFLILALALLAAGCTGLTELPMYWGNNAASPDIKPTGYHAESKTGWMSYNDSSHVYFAFSYFDPRIQSQILRSGMTVFIDTTGKMKEGCFVRFPMIKREMITGAQPSLQPRTRQGTPSRGERSGTEMVLDQAQGFELQWQKGDDVIQVNPSMEKTDFKTSIGLDSTNALNMVIGVPLKMINPNGLQSLDKMVIGLRFGQSPVGPGQGGQRQEMSGGNQQQVISGSSAGTGGGGGGRGGRGGGRGGSGGGGGGGGSAGGGNPRMSAGPQGMDNGPLEYWYKTTMIKR